MWVLLALVLLLGVLALVGYIGAAATARAANEIVRWQDND